MEVHFETCAETRFLALTHRPLEKCGPHQTPLSLVAIRWCCKARPREPSAAPAFPMRRGFELLYFVASTGGSRCTLPPATALAAFPGFVHGKSTPARSTVATATTPLAMSTEVRADLEFGETTSSRSWRSLLEVSIAKSRKIRGSNYVQVATVDYGAAGGDNGNGEPRVRTVVFRGFLGHLSPDHRLYNCCDDGGGGDSGKMSCLMKMCTDSRSRKVGQTARQPVAEMVWWFPKTSEQYRIRGRMVLVGDDDADADDRALTIARKELWGNISDPARESFLDPTLPGAPYVEELAAAIDDDGPNIMVVVPPLGGGGRDDEGKVLPPPKNFLLMVLDPYEVDYLRLTGAQYRQIDRRSAGTDGDGRRWSSERVNP